MRIKQRPEDFSVKESYRFDPVASGRYRVYMMDKQKLSTFDAVDQIRERFGLKPGAVSYCGLKDKQGRTEQIIAVEGGDVDIQEPNLRLKFLGRTDKPLSAANITSNRFSVTVRALEQGDVGPLTVSAAEVNRLGVVNYFDSQRFGSLKHGQGFIAKDLIRGDFEAALRNYLAKPSLLDRSEDAKVKQFWKENWGKWDRQVPYAGTKKYFRILKSLREDPTDYLKAFLQIDSSYRAMLLFTYQSYLWNEGVRRYLQLLFPREHLFVTKYQAGTLLFHREAHADVMRKLRDQTFPLLGPTSTFTDPQVQEAVEWSLGKEKLKLEELKIEEAPKMLYFKHEERPLLVFPQKLVLSRAQADELNRGQVKVNVAFTLPPGAYATLAIKRLFHATYRDDTNEEILETQRNVATRVAARAAREEAAEEAEDERPSRRSASFTQRAGSEKKEWPSSRPAAGGRVTRTTRRAAQFGHAEPAPPRTRTLASPGSAAAEAAAPSSPSMGFRERQKVKKTAKKEAQGVTAERLQAAAQKEAAAAAPARRKGSRKS